MKILERGNLTYYVKEESIVVGIRNFQWISYNVYSLQNRKPFYDFRRKLLKSKPDEYATAAELMLLGQKHGLRGVAGRKPEGVA